eukprot:PhF_6_TR14210/c0_g1_i8/m.22782
MYVTHAKHEKNCMICPRCNNCTGLGIGCCYGNYKFNPNGSNTPQHLRIAGRPCGCGLGKSGCATCGLCKSCCDASTCRGYMCVIPGRCTRSYVTFVFVVQQTGCVVGDVLPSIESYMGKTIASLKEFVPLQKHRLE